MDHSLGSTFIVCMTVNKESKLSERQFPRLYNGDN